ncbi:hypothetical protein ABZS96_25975 [Streptomyces avermitilis]|uniref:hypothetical protein n=1 Tax=Streptomyces avermitilis TaxID=33903 RepID=UPI0033A1FC89
MGLREQGPHSSKTFYSRWLYKKPGGKTHVGKSWKKNKDTAKEAGSFVGVDWYAGKHRGPKFPKGTKNCIQFKGYTAKSCHTLK